MYSKILEVSKEIVDAQSKLCPRRSKVLNVESFASTQSSSPKRSVMYLINKKMHLQFE